MAEEVIVTSLTNLQNEVRYGGDKTFITDEPAAVGGDDKGADPYTLLLGALGSCISMTVTMYAKRKSWQLDRVRVRLRHARIHAKDCAECESADGYVLRIERAVSFEGALTDEQQRRLHEIALKCPLHKTLASEIVFAKLND